MQNPKMDKSREIVFHMARRAIWAKRELRKFDKSGFSSPHMRFAIHLASNEAQNCYRVAKMVLDDVEFD